jgi:protein-S-isoprenylcysteine O-methyltransferase Ste14
MLLVRAIAAFLALPAMVGFCDTDLARHLVTSSARTVQYFVSALVLVGLGTLLLLWCVREFYVSGRGTLAPWDPPRHLVTGGPYRFSRNPFGGIAPPSLIIVGADP